MEDEVDRIVARWKAVRPDLDLSPAEVLQRITRAYGLQAISFNTVFARYGLTWGEHLVLAALRRAGPPYRMSPTTLFNAMMLSSGAMTNRLDRLEEMGLIKRLPDPDDRRGRLVELSPKGLKVVDEAVAAHFANEAGLLKGLTARERTTLSALLKKLLLSDAFQALDPAAKASARRASATSTRGSRRPRT
jgi:DNA-binding MarR family transcriptional regulator